jgi:hypothetical protein
MHDFDTRMIDTTSTKSNMYFSISFSDIKGILSDSRVNGQYSAFGI